MILTYRYRLLPSKRQHAVLAAICEAQRQLYNAALEERIGAYRTTGKGRSYIDQCKALTQWRGEDADAVGTPLNLQRWTLKRIDDAYQAFFRRVKARKGKAGFPRFRGKGYWDSFGFAEFSGIRFDSKRLRWKGLPGALRVHLHRPLLNTDIRSCVFRRDHKGWSVCLQISVDTAAKRPVSSAIGIDVGLTTLAVMSDGSTTPNLRIAKRAERNMRRRQRALARCKRGSNRRRKVKLEVTRAHAKIAATRATYLHQVSAALVAKHDLIAIEKLNVKGLAQSFLARSVHDASWAKLFSMLRYKAERAGVQLIEVNPRNTSQACSNCGVIVPKTLRDRRHECDCGLSLDRDENAARNVLHWAVAGPGSVNVTQWGERWTGNIS